MRKKVGLALGSGGAKGVAHVGVLQALQKHNIPIDYISGASIGAYIGGLYAYYGDIHPIQRIAKNHSWQDFIRNFDIRLHRKGVFKGDRYLRFLKRWFAEDDVADTKIPLSIIATDIITGQKVVIKKGKIAEAVRSSISVPVLFQPWRWEDKYELLDGGLSAPVPVEDVRAMGADVVIAVNLDHVYFDPDNPKNAKPKFNYFELLNRTLNLFRYHLAAENCRTADVVLQPKVDGYWQKFVDSEDFIKEGERVVEEKIEEIKRVISDE